MLVRSTSAAAFPRQPPSPSSAASPHLLHHPELPSRHPQGPLRGAPPHRREQHPSALVHAAARLNLSALGALRDGGTLREAAALLSAALRRIRTGLRDEGQGSPPARRNGAATVTVRPFYLVLARSFRLIEDPTSFHPFLAGMALRVAGAGGGTAPVGAAAAVCYNLGLVHHLAGLERADQERALKRQQRQQEQEQEQDEEEEEQGEEREGALGPQALALLRKALKLYRLAAAVLGDKDEDSEAGAGAPSSCDADDPFLLLRAAILANAGHVHALLLRGEDEESSGQVGACADGIAELLRDPARAKRLAGLVLHGHEEAGDGSAVGGALLLSLEMNALLHSAAGRPAPCA
jgi:hypothetical protein